MSTDPKEVHGSTRSDIAKHYDAEPDIFRRMLSVDLDYCAGRWNTPEDSLEMAHANNLHWFTFDLMLGQARILDIGCGWGSALLRLAREAPDAYLRGITMSQEQATVASEQLRGNPRAAVTTSSWEELAEPSEPYELIVCFGAFEHFAKRGSSPSERSVGYRHFFSKCAHMLAENGRLALQTSTLCRSDADLAMLDSPVTRCLSSVFPGAVPPTEGEVEDAALHDFYIVRRETAPTDYLRTYRLWYENLLERQAGQRVGSNDNAVRSIREYLAATMAVFRSGYWSMDRLLLQKRASSSIVESTMDGGSCARLVK
jgi:cyclopropane-fatty-acyl-phospholipid synthase